MTEPFGGCSIDLFGADDFAYSNFLSQSIEPMTDDADTQTTISVQESDPNPQSASYGPHPAVPFDPSALGLDDFDTCQEIDPSILSLMDTFWDDPMQSELLADPGAENLSHFNDQLPVSFLDPFPNTFLDTEVSSANISVQSGYLQPTINTRSYHVVANIPPTDLVGSISSHFGIATIPSVDPLTRPASRPTVVIPPLHPQYATTQNKTGLSLLSHQYNQESLESESSTSSPELTPSKPAGPLSFQKYFDEKPEASSEHPWGRINASTRGLTSRTGKINHFKPEEVYQTIPHPLNREWTTRGGKKFAYNQWGELQRASFGSNMLKEFILQHPKTKDCKLTLYIQRSPADSMRRYPTKNGSACRFAECPMRKYGLHGKITHGHYRVALDDLSYKYGAKELNDPMIVPGYVHLYCLERFTDFPALCQLPHIRVIADSRTLSKEPNGKFHAALPGTDFKIASSFIEACKRDTLREHPEFTSYPVHQEYRDADNKRQVSPKHHNMTLNHILQNSRNAERSLKVRNEKRPSNVAVHLGDLEIYCQARKGIIMSLADVPSPVEEVAEMPKTLKTSKKAADKTNINVAPLDDYSPTSSEADDDSQDGFDDDSDEQAPVVRPSDSRKRYRCGSYGSRSYSGSNKRRRSSKRR
jgi:hypothetical protein